MLKPWSLKRSDLVIINGSFDGESSLRRELSNSNERIRSPEDDGEWVSNEVARRKFPQRYVLVTELLSTAVLLSCVAQHLILLLPPLLYVPEKYSDSSTFTRVTSSSRSLPKMLREKRSSRLERPGKVLRPNRPALK